jgi:predicted aspartyl protease
MRFRLSARVIQAKVTHAMNLEDHPAYRLAEYGPIIDVEVNGHPVRALIDTGAKMSAISRKTAQQLGLADTGDRAQDFLRGESPIYSATVVVKGEQIKDQELCSFEMSPALPHAFLIGRDILVRFVLSYDGLSGTFDLQRSA